MNHSIRKSIITDATAFVKIKDQLPMLRSQNNRGGFLLGTNKATYQSYIKNAYSLSAIQNKKVIGFGIIFQDEVLRNTELWQKRSMVDWAVDISQLEQKKICYFEQLAFLTGHRRQVLTLAYNLVNFAFQQGHDVLLTTTVKKPILNLAAVPFIKAAGGKKVGEIDEVYPIIGQIQSSIYLIHANDFYTKVRQHPLFPFLKSNTII